MLEVNSYKLTICGKSPIRKLLLESNWSLIPFIADSFQIFTIFDRPHCESCQIYLANKLCKSIFVIFSICAVKNNFKHMLTLKKIFNIFICSWIIVCCSYVTSLYIIFLKVVSNLIKNPVYYKRKMWEIFLIFFLNICIAINIRANLIPLYHRIAYPQHTRK